MASKTEEKVYQPKDAIAAALKTTMLTGGIGLFASAVQNTLVKENVGPWGVFVRSGSTIGIFGTSLPRLVLRGACLRLTIIVQRPWVVPMSS